MKLVPGDTAADYANALDPKAVAQMGYKAVARYINGDPTSWKVLTPVERDELHAAGLGIWLVFERSALRPLSGYAAGLEDGKRAQKHAESLRYPETMPVLVAFDTDVTASNMAACVAYWRGFNETCDYPTGLYGDWDIIEALKGMSVLNWQANARYWSASRVHPMTHLMQRLGVNTPAGRLDPNNVLREAVAWHPKTVEVLGMEYVIVKVVGSNALFYTMRDKRGLLGALEWTGPGSNPDVQLRLKMMRGAGAPEVELAFEALKMFPLNGPLPYGDPGHEWTGDEFLRMVD